MSRMSNFSSIFFNFYVYLKNQEATVYESIQFATNMTKWTISRYLPKNLHFRSLLAQVMPLQLFRKQDPLTRYGFDG